jgi:hypothetical protein
MANKIQTKKVVKKEEQNLHLEVVLLDEIFQVLLNNVIEAMFVLRDAAFCSECSRKKTK